jgi:hypothetical protein
MIDRRELERTGKDVSFGLIRKIGIIGSGPPPLRRANHKMSKTPEYRAWTSAQVRCSNPNSRSYRHYGGRGIRFAKEWVGGDGFLRFLQHVGQRPSSEHSLDRINVNGHYEPGNVRWATASVQSQNRRNTLLRPNHDNLITAFGVTHTVAEWADAFGCSTDRLATALAKRKL